MRVDFPGRAQRGADERQVAAHQPPLRRAAAQAVQRELWRLRQPTARLLAALQLGEQRRLGGFLAVAQQVGGEHGPVEADKARMARQGQVQGGDVAVAHEGFGVAAQQRKVDACQQPRAAVAAAQANNGVHAGVGKGAVQLVQPLRIAGGQVVVLLRVARARVGAGVQARHKTALHQPVGHLLRAPCCGRGRGQHRHRAPAGQRRYGLQALHQPWGAWHGGGAHQRLAGCGRLERWGVAATAAAGL